MIERDEIEAVAANARLLLDDDEITALQDDFAAILDSFQGLDDIDTDGVKPSFHPVEHGERMREDAPGDCLSQDEALSNTENTEDGYFTGPRAT